MGVEWIKEEERDKKKSVSEKESYKLTAEMEHLMAERGSSYPQAPRSTSPAGPS